MIQDILQFDKISSHNYGTSTKSLGTPKQKHEEVTVTERYKKLTCRRWTGGEPYTVHAEDQGRLVWVPFPLATLPVSQVTIVQRT